MASKQDKLKELQEQVKLKKQQQVKHIEVEEDDLRNFIDDSQDDEKHKQKYTHFEEEEEDNKQPNNIKPITAYIRQAIPRQKKEGIQLNIDDMVLEQPVEQIQINQPIQTLEDLNQVQYDAPLMPQKVKEDSIDMDELEELLKQRPKTQIVKPQAVHRVQPQLNLSQRVECVQSTLDESTMHRSHTKNVNDIVEKNKSILFYWMDIYEDVFAYPGQLLLFGKVKNYKLNKYESCTVYFPDYPKIVYLHFKGDYTEEQLEEECAKLMKRYCGLLPKDYSTRFVNKKYAFEFKEIPTEDTDYMEVTMTQKSSQQLPMKLESHIFKYALQTTMSTIEQFLIYNAIKGPCWLLIKSCEVLDQISGFRVSTTHFLQLKPESISSSNHQPTLPPLRLMSIALKICNVGKEEQIIAISLAIQDNVDQDGAEGDDKMLFNTILRMPKDEAWPSNHKMPSAQYTQVTSENALLSLFVQKVSQYDPDAIVGHDLMQRQLILLADRMKRTNLKSWNLLSRLQRVSQIPKKFNIARVMTIGRLMVDTYLQAKELVKSNDYSLKFLSQKFLKIEQVNVESDQVGMYLDNMQNITHLMNYNIQDAKLILLVTAKLQVISLTKQLTNIAGNTWIRSLQNQRAERNEMLLMHEFYQRGYLLPDRLAKAEDESPDAAAETTKSSYLGGMVFEPKADIYTDFVLLLDFNSLYPSIIMEYNICFTNVIRTKVSIEQQSKPIDEIGTPGAQDPEGILPQIINNLIKMRNGAKKKMAQSTGIEKQVWNIRQLAVKLVANSMYGCLGFKLSRFYAVGIASLITMKGREILMNSKALVERYHNVIYGDTDSVMIVPKLPTGYSMEEVVKVGHEIKKLINSQYKKLQIGIDGIFVTLLLLRKKKYAAVKVANLDDVLAGKAQVIQERETKGIDIVRREFCKFSKMVQGFVLDILLEPKNRDTMFNDIYQLMEEVGQVLGYYSGESSEQIGDIIARNRFLKQECTSSSFIIIKQLSRAPHEYTDADKHPHVQVAKRKIDNGSTPESLVNHFINYIICKDDNQKLLALRAYAPEEVIKGNLPIDYQYYKQTQVLDPVGRLCKNISGLLLSKVAQLIGVKTNKYKDQLDTLQYKIILPIEDINEYLSELKFNCIHCGKEQLFESFYHNKSWDIRIVCTICLKENNGDKFRNQIKLLLKSLCNQYYKGIVGCQVIKYPSLCFTISGKCFGTCCDGTIRKPLKSEIKQMTINQQVKLLEELVNRLGNSNKLQSQKPFLNINVHQLFNMFDDLII